MREYDSDDNEKNYLILCSLACILFCRCTWYANPIMDVLAVGSDNGRPYGSSNSDVAIFHGDNENFIKYGNIRLMDENGNLIDPFFYSVMEYASDDYRIYLDSAYCYGNCFIVIPHGEGIDIVIMIEPQMPVEAANGIYKGMHASAEFMPILVLAIEIIHLTLI